MTQEYTTPNKAAARSHIPVDHIREACENEIPGATRTEGGHWRIPIAALDEWAALYEQRHEQAEIDRARAKLASELEVASKYQGALAAAYAAQAEYNEREAERAAIEQQNATRTWGGEPLLDMPEPLPMPNPTPAQLEQALDRLLGPRTGPGREGPALIDRGTGKYKPPRAARDELPHPSGRKDLIWHAASRDRSRGEIAEIEAAILQLEHELHTGVMGRVFPEMARLGREYFEKLWPRVSRFNTAQHLAIEAAKKLEREHGAHITSEATNAATVMDPDAPVYGVSGGSDPNGWQTIYLQKRLTVRIAKDGEL